MDQTFPPFARTDALAATDGPQDTGAAALIALHQRTVDALAGFETMVDKAEPSFRPVAERFRALHAAHAERLARMIVELGHAPDPDGTLMGTVNRAVVSLRALFDDIDEDVMDSVRDGEKHVLEAFDDAIGAVHDVQYRADLGVLRAEVVALVDRTAHLD